MILPTYHISIHICYIKNILRYVVHTRLLIILLREGLIGLNFTCHEAKRVIMQDEVEQPLGRLSSFHL